MRDFHPYPEFPDLGGNTKIVFLKSLPGLPHFVFARTMTGKEDLWPIWNRIAVLQRRNPDAKKTPEIIGITRLVGAIEINAFLVAGPSTIKKGEHSMMGNVDEPNQRRVMGIPQPIAGVSVRCCGKGPFGPNIPRKLTSSGSGDQLFDAFNTGRSKSQRGNLAEAQKILL